MWLNCNLGKVNLRRTLAGQRLSPRHAGLCGVTVWSLRADMRLHVSALLCFALLCNRCGLLLVTACDICRFCFARFCRSFSILLLLYHVDSLGLLTMSRSTRNSRDAMLPSLSTSLASSAGSSTSTAAPSTMSFPSAPVQQIVDAVRASLVILRNRTAKRLSVTNVTGLLLAC